MFKFAPPKAEGGQITNKFQYPNNSVNWKLKFQPEC